jgi:uncharacterized protein (TIGR02145 family)/prepilin-type N-terminal cleavage/methylation domain-containing protein
MKKGFTLVELLAVIIILGFIALLIMPVVTSVINNSQKDSFKASAYGLKKTAEMKYMNLEKEGNAKKLILYYNDGVETSNIEGEYLEYEGEKPNNGYVVINEEGKIAFAIHDGKYCAQKSYYQSEVTVSTKSIDNCDIPFECGQVFIDVRDGEEYKTVQIDDQCWMAENLRYVGEGENTCLTSGGYESCNSAEWGSEPYNSCCVHNQMSESLHSGSRRRWDETQVLYQWGAVMNLLGDFLESATFEDIESLNGTQGICPKGWVVPSNDDWIQLLSFADTKYDADDNVWNGTGWIGFNAGIKLCSSEYWIGEDEYGFNGLPVGFRYPNDSENGLVGALGHVGSYTSWWTSTAVNDSMSWEIGIMCQYEDNIERFENPFDSGVSVRCLYKP